MCCFFASLLFFGPRLAFLVYWLVFPLRVTAAFTQFNFPWLVSLLGLIFLPWTTLMYMIVFPGGVTGFEWVLVGCTVFADIAQ